MVAGVLTTSGACLLKAGANVNSIFTGATAETNWQILINQAESNVLVKTRYNWIDVYSTLNADTKKILDEVTSNKAAMYAIIYDISGYTSRGEAETMLDVLSDGFDKGMIILEEIKHQQFLNGQ